MNTLKKMSEISARNANGGGTYCKLCSYGRDTYKNRADVTWHILRNHFGVFAGTYAYNIWKYRSVLKWALAL